MRRIVLATSATASGLVLLLALKPHSQPSVLTTTAAATPSETPSATPSSNSSAAPTSSPSASATTKATKKATAKRTYTGDAVQTRYGNVQLAITVSGGKITAVKVLQVPGNGPYEQGIVQDAIPQLTSEALSAQSASIDSVSGATFTSEGYVQSLQSAIDKAGI